ncbi:MAG: nucleoside hydrolase, partial [Hungatella sp.]
AGHAVDFMVDTFMNQEHVTLVTLGPLTNVAQAILKEPRLKERIFEILCMGGSATAGNYNGCVEFNMAVDPEAAKIVFDSGIRIKMVGLNLCRQNSMTREDVAILEHMPNQVAKAAAELLEFSVNGDRQAQLCDACAISWLIDPGVVTCALPLHVDVETKGEYTRGMTVCDYRDYIGVTPELDIDRTIRFQISDTVRNAIVAMEFDAGRFKKLLFDTLESYEK